MGEPNGYANKDLQETLRGFSGQLAQVLEAVQSARHENRRLEQSLAQMVKALADVATNSMYLQNLPEIETLQKQQCAQLQSLTEILGPAAVGRDHIPKDIVIEQQKAERAYQMKILNSIVLMFLIAFGGGLAKDVVRHYLGIPETRGEALP